MHLTQSSFSTKDPVVLCQLWKIASIDHHLIEHDPNISGRFHVGPGNSKHRSCFYRQWSIFTYIRPYRRPKILYRFVLPVSLKRMGASSALCFLFYTVLASPVQWIWSETDGVQKLLLYLWTISSYKKRLKFSNLWSHYSAASHQISHSTFLAETPSYHSIMAACFVSID